MRTRFQPTRDGERGVALLNVLAVLALASSVVLLMAAVQEVSIARSERVDEAVTADAAARGGEAAATAALRRAAIETPNVTSYRQAWARLDETAAPILGGGSFTMRVIDAQARFNVNALAHPNLLAIDQLRKIVTVLGFPAGIADMIVARLVITGPVDRLADLAGPGLDAATLTALERFIVALPGETAVNLNTVEEPLLAILLNNAAPARQLVARRERKGELTPADLVDAKVLTPANISFNSSYFDAEVQVTVGETTERLSSLLRRKRGQGGVSVDVIDRKRAAAAPIPADHE